jgi:hypothetical protein
METQIKTTLRWLTSKTLKITSVGKGREKLEFSYIAVGFVKWCTKLSIEL